jgi:hypothetical protein
MKITEENKEELFIEFCDIEANEEMCISKDGFKEAVTKALTLYGVGISLPNLDDRIIEVESQITKNKVNELEHKQAFKLGFKTCYYWMVENIKIR